MDYSNGARCVFRQITQKQFKPEETLMDVVTSAFERISEIQDLRAFANFEWTGAAIMVYAEGWKFDKASRSLSDGVVTAPPLLAGIPVRWSYTESPGRGYPWSDLFLDFTAGVSCSRPKDFHQLLLKTAYSVPWQSRTLSVKFPEMPDRADDMKLTDSYSMTLAGPRSWDNSGFRFKKWPDGNQFYLRSGQNSPFAPWAATDFILAFAKNSAAADAYAEYVESDAKRKRRFGNSLMEAADLIRKREAAGE